MRKAPVGHVGTMTDTGSGTYVAGSGEFTRDQHYIATGSPPDGRDGYPVEPGRYRLVVSRACPWANRAIIVRRLLGLEDAISMGVCGPDPRRAQLDLRPRPRRPRPGARHRAAAGGLLRALPRLRAGHHGAGDGRRPDRAGRHQRLPADHPRPLDGVARATTAPARPTSTPSTCATRWTRSWSGSTATSTTASTGAGSPARRRPTTGRIDRLFDRPGLARGPARRPALPDGRHDHRGRRPAVHDAGPLRRRLPRPLQVQPAEADARCRCCGRTPATCSRRRASATPSTSSQIKQHYYVVHTRHQPDRHRARRARPVAAGSTPHGREALGGRPFGDGTPPPAAARRRARAGRPQPPRQLSGAPRQRAAHRCALLASVSFAARKG